MHFKYTTLLKCLGLKIVDAKKLCNYSAYSAIFYFKLALTYNHPDLTVFQSLGNSETQ